MWKGRFVADEWCGRGLRFEVYRAGRRLSKGHLADAAKTLPDAGCYPAVEVVVWLGFAVVLPGGCLEPASGDCLIPMIRGLLVELRSGVV